MAQYKSGHTGAEFDDTITEVSENKDKWTKKVDDVQVDGTSIVTDKVANLAFNTAYNATTNKAATMKDIDDAIDLFYEEVKEMPVKGNLIEMDLGTTATAGTNNQYRVLKVNGTQAEVVAMFDYSTSTVFNSSSVTTTIGGQTVQKYDGSNLDTVLNTTFYGAMSSSAKAAIVQTAKEIDAWNSSGTKYTDDNTLSRYVYALSMQDLIDYTGNTFSVLYSGDESAGLWQMLWNTTSQPSSYTYPGLRSVCVDNSSTVWGVTGFIGRVYFDIYNTNYAARPAFTIDLSKVDYTIVEE